MSCFKNFKKWVVKNRGITKISLIFVGISFLPVLYVLVKKFFKEYIVLGLKETIDFDWLSYYGSLIGSYLIIYTLYLENKKYREEKRDSVRPIWNIGIKYDSMISKTKEVEKNSKNLKLYLEPSGEEVYTIYPNNSKALKLYRSSQNEVVYNVSQYNYIKIYRKSEGRIIQRNEYTDSEQRKMQSILIKIRNIGSGHALIDKIKYKDVKKSEGEHVLKPYERFMIDKGTSNNLLLQFDSKISDIRNIQVFFIDTLGNEYVYTLVLECERKQDPEYYVKLGEERVYLANLSSAYFENYFPKFLGKVKESNQ